MTRDVIILCAGPSVEISLDPALIVEKGRPRLLAQLDIIRQCRLNPIITLGDNGDHVLETCGPSLEDVDMVFDPAWKLGVLPSIKAALNAAQGPSLVLSADFIYAAEALQQWVRFQAAQNADVWTESDNDFPWLVTEQGIIQFSKISSLTLQKSTSLVFRERPVESFGESSPVT